MGVYWSSLKTKILTKPIAQFITSSVKAEGVHRFGSKYLQQEKAPTTAQCTPNLSIQASGYRQSVGWDGNSQVSFKWQPMPSGKGLRGRKKLLID